MANYISPDEFINETDGKAYDMDGAYGVQCVDGIKKFVQDVYGESNFTCGNDYAYGLWTNYGSNGVEKYFDRYPFNEAKKGDWIIWNWGSPEAEKSHVGMFYELLGDRVRTYGQNQNGIKAFNFCNISVSGILGVLRPKIYEGQEPTEDYPFEGIVKKGAELYNENGYKYPGDCKANRDCTVEGELNGRYKVYCFKFDPTTVYTDKENVIKKDTSIYPFNAIIKKGSKLYDVNGNIYNKANANRNVIVQGEVNGRYQIYGETFTPHVVYCDKNAIM